MGFWRKKFTDETVELGTDAAVEARQASWTHGRHNGISSVELSHSGLSLEISGEGEYWQSDTFESVFPNPHGVLLKRRIQRRIEPTDTHFRLVCLGTTLRILFNANDVIEGGRYVVVDPSMKGKWIIAELDLNTNKVCHYLRENRI